MTSKKADQQAKRIERLESVLKIICTWAEVGYEHAGDRRQMLRKIADKAKEELNS